MSSAVTMPDLLIGRDAELALLGNILDTVQTRGAAIIVRGQPGVGKSSLLRAGATMAAARGASVLRASGIESEAMQPFAGLRRLLQPLVDGADALPRVQRHALLTAFGTEQGPPPALFLTALAAMTLVVDAASSQPVVLLIDDAQWLDAPTIEVLAFISRRLQQDPVIMMVALRDGHTLALSEADATELNLQGLDSTSSRELLATVADDLTTADELALLRQARGNPLALVELPAAWRSSGRDVFALAAATVPLTVRLERAFAARIAELPSKTRAALLIAAVDADESLAEILAATEVLSGRTSTTEDLEPAVKARLIEFDQAHIRFRHPLVRSGVLHSESVHRRQRAHAALGQVLPGEPYRQVWHQAQSVDGPDDEIAGRLDASHLDSMRRGSVLSAIAALQRSAQLTEDTATRARRLLLAAQHAFGLGRADLVSRLVDSAEASTLNEADRARAEWLRELFTEGELGDSDRIRELCNLAARSATATDVDLALDLLASAALRCWWSAGNVADRQHVVWTAQDLTAMQDDPRCISVIAVADPLGQVAVTQRRLETQSALGVSDTDQLRWLGRAARAIGAEPMAADLFDAAEIKLRERGQLGLLSQVLAVQAAVYLDLGKWPQAGQNLEEGRLLAQETGQSTWRAGAAAVEAVYEGLTGESELALRHAAEIEAAHEHQMAGDFRSLAQLARGTAHLSAGRPADAYSALAPIFDPAGPCHHPREQLSAVTFIVEAAVNCGAADDVRGLIDRLNELSRSTPSQILLVHLLHANALLADDNDAERLFRHALAQDLTRWPWPRARIELGYGNWLRRQRRPSDARLPLRTALSTFDALGAREWARQARSALRACGDRASVREPIALASTMTAQEMQIVRLVAQGLSNREIAQQLYLSPRTIGSHLYRIFPKLGITSRTQVAARMAEF